MFDLGGGTHSTECHINHLLEDLGGLALSFAECTSMNLVWFVLPVWVFQLFRDEIQLIPKR